ncbi:MAG: YdeI/OmpD-associated family protein, partial [Undibacterium sp.]|nr:YdeI/OmpD-associated family protein [Undibacterium sp.]
EAFSYSKKKDYVVWYTEAKTDATRDKRLAQTVEWLAEGKSRNWKYENC